MISQIMLSLYVTQLDEGAWLYMVLQNTKVSLPLKRKLETLL